MTTMDRSIEQFLKDLFLENVFVEDGDAIRVADEIAGLPNIGKTFFVFESEINEKALWAEQEMIKKYGAEIYGTSA